MRESNGTDGTGLVEPHFNEAFLNGENSKNTKLGQVYKNVEFPFTQKQIFKDEPGVNYWWYDAAKLHYTCVRIILPERITWAMEKAMDQQ